MSSFFSRAIWPEDPDQRLRRLVLLTSATLFVLSLFFPAYWVRGYADTPIAYMGWKCFLWAPIAAFIGFPEAAANLLFLVWLPLSLAKRFVGNLLAILLGLIALLLALLFLQRDAMPLNEGQTGPVLGLGLGYYLWISAMASALFGSIACLFRRN